MATTSAAPEPSATAETPSGATLSLPALKADQTPLIRTDFSDDDAWDRVVAAVRAPAAFDGETYTPPIVPVSDRTFDGLTAPALTAGRPRDRCGHAILADAASMRAADDITVEYVDLCDDPGSAFRAAAHEVAEIEANLAIANLALGDYADRVGPDGVFRGFPK